MEAMIDSNLDEPFDSKGEEATGKRFGRSSFDEAYVHPLPFSRPPRQFSCLDLSLRTPS